ncbi:MAG: ABC transporter permease [Acidimicrobiales bacterium]
MTAADTSRDVATGPSPPRRRAQPIAAEVGLVARFTARDYLRRPGAWLTTLLTGVLFALLAAGAASVSQRVQDRAERISFAVAVEGDRDGATRFLADLDDPRLVLRPSSDAAAEVTASKASSGLVLPDRLDERVAAGEPTELRVFYRAGNDNSQASLNTVALRLQAVEEGDLVAVLERAGAAVPSAVGLEEREVRQDERVNRRQISRTLAALVCLLCLGVVSSVAALAGSGREHRSAEPMLVLPLRRAALTAGSALGVFPLVSIQLFAAVAIVVGATGLPLVGLAQPAGAIAGMLVTALPAAALLGLLATGAGGLAGVIGTGTDDAVSLGDFFAVPFVAVGVVLFLQPDLPSSVATMAVPILGAALVLRDGVAGDLSALHAVVAATTTAAWLALLLWLAARRVDDERRVLRATR